MDIIVGRMHTVPARVAAFTTRHLDTIEDLQVLVACMESSDRWWSSGSTARELGLTPATARRSLDRLSKRNLFDIRVSDDVRYRFAPGASALEADAREWLAEYRRNPLAVAKLVSGSRGIRDFADAFRIKRRHDDR
jgi:hypothetical protein